MLQIEIATPLRFACIITMNLTLHGSEAKNTLLRSETGAIGIYTTVIVPAISLQLKFWTNPSSSEGAANES